ncbi:MBL fold metallo-hydrolase [Agrobacterium rhizogenes]|uniref:MBL fold metallo-hydrolase n=1 Tax=Rhizobium rhizogenes TaxID=359 RepID=UPI001574D14F|nr:MBL fold metallo-hydrolase [Rhizobium rhizogenes]NTH16725.1 MBL fold metallo-hydrolase [Rhizobium rhizogenes]
MTNNTGVLQKLQHFGNASSGWHRFMLGDFEITAISDGPMPMRPPSAGFAGAPLEEIDALLTESYLSTDQLLLSQNAILVNNGRQLILIDTGMGDSMGPASHLFGPSTGHLLENLRSAGFKAEDVDVVILTHGHADHSWGLTDIDGNAVFPNAQLAISEKELSYWLDESNRKVSEFADINVSGAIKNFSPYLDRLIMVKDGQQVVPGVVAMACPGHTVGHHGYIIDSNGQTLVNTGDMAHHHVLALRRPEWEISFDSDPKLAVASRIRILDMLAADRVAVLGYHFPWPGLGHIARAGDAYAWVPSPVETYMM